MPRVRAAWRVENRPGTWFGCGFPRKVRKFPQLAWWVRRLESQLLSDTTVQLPRRSREIARFRLWHETCKGEWRMATGTVHIEGQRAGTATDVPRIVVIEDNPLTAWAIERTLAPTFEVVQRSTLSDAATELQQHGAAFVICGSPYADDQPDELKRFAEAVGPHVIALVSDPDCGLSAWMPVLEKPFELARLLELLIPARCGAGKFVPPPGRKSAVADRLPQRRTIMNSLAERLDARFKESVCPLCVHRTADGGCTLTEHRECPIFEWARQVAEVVEGIDSSRLGDYMDKIQAIICPSCMQLANGHCKARDHLDCPLDLYLGLVVPIIEEELKRGSSE